MKKSKLVLYFMMTAYVITIFAACSKKDAGGSSDYSRGYTNEKFAEAPGYDNDYDSAVGESDIVHESKSEATSGDFGAVQLSNTAVINNNESLISSNDKIIRRISMEVETLEFDRLIGSIDDQIILLNGYVENSDISGRRFYAHTNSKLRRAHLVVRIPKDKVNEFVNHVNREGNIVLKKETTENVTLKYIDTQSRKRALEIEQDRLLVLLERADKLDDIFKLETRLSSLRYELQGFEMKLRTYDNQVEYSTITLSINEVEELTIEEEEEEEEEVVVTFGGRIQDGFKNSIKDITEGFKNFLVWFVTALPYLVIWGVIITLIVMATLKIYRKSNEKFYATQQKGQQPNQNQNNNNNQ